jgi:hypothetical protein
MKFYREYHNSNHFNNIICSKLTGICCNKQTISFLKNGKFHNYKNAAYIENSGYKEFILNDITFGCAFDFAKKSWRRFVKMQKFL